MRPKPASSQRPHNGEEETKSRKAITAFPPIFVRQPAPPIIDDVAALEVGVAR
jgi:hypothetical protein